MCWLVQIACSVVAYFCLLVTHVGVMWKVIATGRAKIYHAERCACLYIILKLPMEEVDPQQLCLHVFVCFHVLLSVACIRSIVLSCCFCHGYFIVLCWISLLPRLHRISLIPLYLFGLGFPTGIIHSAMPFQLSSPAIGLRPPTALVGGGGGGGGAVRPPGVHYMVSNDHHRVVLPGVMDGNNGE